MPLSSNFFCCLLESLIKNLDLFFINTSVFFFAINYLQSKKEWKKELLITEVETSTWGEMKNIGTFIKHAKVVIDAESLQEHPNWKIRLTDGRTMTATEYMNSIFIPENYGTAFDYKLKSEQKAHFSTLLGGILLILGSFISLYKNVDNCFIALLTLICYIICAVILLSLFQSIISHIQHRRT